jgi:hypothetical protein
VSTGYELMLRGGEKKPYIAKMDFIHRETYPADDVNFLKMEKDRFEILLALNLNRL